MTDAVHTEQRWSAPFAPSQVAALNERQRESSQPYLCADPSHPPLVACEGGWWCKGRRCIEEQQDWAEPVEVTLRHHLIAADLPAHTETADDGYDCVVVHSPEEAADRALAVITAAARLLPEGGVTRTEWRVRYVGLDNRTHHTPMRDEADADQAVADLARRGAHGHKERRTVTTHEGPWEPVHDSRTDVGHRYADPETLASYAGSWVLVRKRRVVASAPTARALVDEARRRSLLLGYAFYVPVEPVHVDA